MRGSCTGFPCYSNFCEWYNIPKRANPKSTSDHIDWDLYNVGHLVENALAKLKQYKAAAKFDKLKQSYENTVALAWAYIWLKL